MSITAFIDRLLASLTEGRTIHNQITRLKKARAKKEELAI